MSRVVFRVHAIKRMFQRRISEMDVRNVLQNGETIEAYPNDKPYPSKLVMGWCGNRPLHVVLAEDNDSQETIIITVYEPDPAEWEEDLKRRRR